MTSDGTTAHGTRPVASTVSADAAGSAPLLEIVVPVFDEERSLEQSIRTLHAALRGQFGDRWLLTIADNASTDATPAIADALAAELERVRAVHLAEKGRGRALKQVWLASEAEVVGYLDVDLSTDLAALAPLVAPLLSRHSDLAIGTRLSADARVVRGAKREIVSRGYNALLRATGLRASDAQCGFKAMRSDVARRILPFVEDTGWFFDTEVLMIAERSGLRIHEVPVDWVDDEDSKVDIVATALADLRGVVRVLRGIGSRRIPVEAIYAELGRRPFEPAHRPGFFGQVLRFGLIGGASTVAYAVLYLLLQLAIAPQVANFAALLVTAVANTWANRRITFGVRGRPGIVGDQLKGLLVFLLAWCLTSGSLLVLHAARPESGAVAELVVLTVANLVATVLRFVLLRAWVFRRARRGVASAALDPAADAATAIPTSRRADDADAALQKEAAA
ncbi:bifunctional glycosyltransferase family 2/GtrA family protein [Schumannella sp. 10F1B-5-1]|uniref:bifunctional glycosyltransferase family 2/GtrA family protein n=1 Tax=Schumannella sp. 10F1B-5-1 TaxID=2590780 RepID=UPI001132377D|nr:bifunctional glycosyltransferase family 2/GtrA family protein [Schumannella sp. 10F1B-5-1]TPW73442.1 glycosyltransferase [Schumannella sp. 10F1B-5-1]